MPISKTNNKVDINQRRIINGADADVIQLYPMRHMFAWEAYNTGNANHWLDVRNSLPLLTQERWYMRTRHGYARGYETVAYVGNVRTHYDMLNWITSGAPKGGTPLKISST